MPVPLRPAPLLGALLAAAALTACGVSVTTGERAAPLATDPTTGSPCPTSAELAARGLYDPADGVPLPAGFQAAEAAQCSLEERSYAGEGRWSVLVERRASEGLSGLLSALERPSEPTRAAMCDAVGYQVAWFALRGADGGWIHPAVPATWCGQPLPQFREAYAALPLHEVAVTRIAQVLTPEEEALESDAAALGCTTPFKDLVARADADGRAGASGRRAGPAPLSGTGPVAVCRMRTDPTAEEPVLRFVSGERVAGASRTALADALAASVVPAPACTVPHTSVALLLPGNGSYVLVELDGCRRVYSEEAPWLLSRATPELLAALG